MAATINLSSASSAALLGEFEVFTALLSDESNQPDKEHLVTLLQCVISSSDNKDGRLKIFNWIIERIGSELTGKDRQNVMRLACLNGLGDVVDYCLEKCKFKPDFDGQILNLLWLASIGGSARTVEAILTPNKETLPADISSCFVVAAILCHKGVIRVLAKHDPVNMAKACVMVGKPELVEEDTFKNLSPSQPEVKDLWQLAIDSQSGKTLTLAKRLYPLKDMKGLLLGKSLDVESRRALGMVSRMQQDSFLTELSTEFPFLTHHFPLGEGSLGSQNLNDSSQMEAVKRLIKTLQDDWQFLPETSWLKAEFEIIDSFSFGKQHEIEVLLDFGVFERYPLHITSSTKAIFKGMLPAQVKENFLGQGGRFAYENFLELILKRLSGFLQDPKTMKDLDNLGITYDREFKQCQNCAAKEVTESSCVYQPKECCVECKVSLAHTDQGICMLLKWRDTNDLIRVNITPIFNFKDEIRTKDPNASILSKVLSSLVKERPPYWVPYYKEAIILETIMQYSIDERKTEFTKIPLKLLYHGPMSNYVPYPFGLCQSKDLSPNLKSVLNNIKLKYAGTNVPRLILKTAVCNIGDIAAKSGCSSEQIESFVENHVLFGMILKLYGISLGSKEEEEDIYASCESDDGSKEGTSLQSLPKAAAYSLGHVNVLKLPAIHNPDSANKSESIGAAMATCTENLFQDDAMIGVPTGYAYDTAGPSHRSLPALVRPSPSQSSDEKYIASRMEKLADMGFINLEENMAALESCQGDFNAALDKLLIGRMMKERKEYHGEGGQY